MLWVYHAMTERERQFLELVREFPDSPMGHFTLGRHYLEERRWAEAARSLEEAVRLDPVYAAALVCLGDAYAALGDPGKAKETYLRALASPLGQRDHSLVEDVERRLSEL
ncbi:MAG: tetratricopeptide repeat protein [Myxococcales bacterium]|nr:tetratricopeptide repeat protein [Myxococcales bacterium]